MSLEESNLISPDIKIYNSTYKVQYYINSIKIEDSLNEVVNEVMRLMPEDPYSQFTGYFAKVVNHTILVYLCFNFYLEMQRNIQNKQYTI